MAIILTVVLVISKLFAFFSLTSSATDTITQSQPLLDGNTLVSSGGTFELGFFNPGNSTNRYVGIWYHNIPVRRAVWVANRDNPIKDNSSKLIISQDGNLMLFSQNQTLLWSTNATSKASSPILQLLDNGNLVLKDGNDNNNEQSFLWQSFDHPSDTLLPGMKLRWDRKNDKNHSLSAWKNWDDPSTGDLTLGIVHGNNPELVLSKGSEPFYRSGPWNGIQFGGAFALRDNPLYDKKFVNNEDEVYYMYTLKNSSVISIYVLNQTLSSKQRLIWVPQTRTWIVYGKCVVDALPVCQCLEGFEPKSLQSWNAMDWTQGCVRSDKWSCGVKSRDGFRKFARMKLPDTLHSWVDASMTLDDCEIKCLENCSCTAYTNLDIRAGGSGCAIWFGDLNDMRVLEAGQDLYVRMVATDAEHHSHKRKVVMAVTITVVLILMVLLALSCTYWLITKNKGDQLEGNTNRIVGTHCYIAPEYVFHGQFSIKSDVFSFGVLLLEIISGKKNKGLPQPSNSHNLIEHAWRMWKMGIIEEFIDATLRDSCILSEAPYYIQIGLLCLQHHPDDRPKMASIVVMLNREILCLIQTNLQVY